MKLEDICNLCNYIESNADCGENARLLRVLCKGLEDEDYETLAYIKKFAVREMNRVTDAVAEAESYRAKDLLFGYGDVLLQVYTFAIDKDDMPKEDEAESIRKLVTLARSERTLEAALDAMFELEKIEKADVEKLLESVKPITDVYRRGMLFKGILEYKKQTSKLSRDAKELLAEFVADELESMLAKPERTADELENIEFIVDICKYFISKRLLDLLERTKESGTNEIRYYALETLVANNRAVTVDDVRPLAEDLYCAELTHSMLVKHGKPALFPKEYDTPEYLAKSNMVHWLMYPTELGKAPDAIELIGNIWVDKENYYVFKFMSNSDTLTDDLHDKWLIGWSNDNGNTFSNFDLLSDYEQKTVKKTLKNIAKKLLR